MFRKRDITRLRSAELSSKGPYGDGRVVIGNASEDLLEATKSIVDTVGISKHDLTPKEVEVAKDIVEILKPLSPVDRESVSNGLLAGFESGHHSDPEVWASAKREILRRRVEVLKREMKGIRSDLEKLEGERALIMAEMLMVAEPEIVAAAREWQCPPGKPKTAANLELLSMNCARFSLKQSKMWDALLESSRSFIEEDWQWLHSMVARRYPVVARVMDASSAFYSLFESDEHESLISEFHERWVASSFSRLEVGHKLAAALCLTDVPDEVEVRAPWEAWSLLIPDGLLPTIEDPRGQISRLWILGIEPAFGVTTAGQVVEVRKFPTADGARLGEVFRNFIRGACLALSNPEEFKKEGQGGASRASKKGRQGPPDLVQARFLLSAPVKVDLREHLRGVLGGHKGTSPTVQFLVRGHWRNQAHGAGRALRKTIWIQPFWKGPEESRVLLRQYQVKGEE